MYSILDNLPGGDDLTLGEYIKKYRTDHRYSMDEFAKRVNMSKAYISILERNYNPSTGKAAVPSLETIRRVALATGTDFNELIAMLDGDQQISLGNDDEAENVPSSVRYGGNIIPLPATKKIPLIGAIACGAPILAEEHIEDYVDTPTNIHADFALICKGDSMINARIFDGDVVYVRQQKTVENGEIAAVLIDNEATLKRVRLFEDHIVLEPENPHYRPLAFWGEEMNNIQILGKAVAFTSTVR